jgi:RNA-directed DNA polymerase
MDEVDAAKRAGKPERPRGEGGGTAGIPEVARQASRAQEEPAGHQARSLIEEVLRRANLIKAHQRVVRNGGAPGIDGMTVENLMPYCREHWDRIREELRSGRYQPRPVRKVEIPKPDGKGTRMLGIPTVLDRLIQQALLQVLTPIFDPTFSDASFGFRQGRSTHDAVLRAREHIVAGHRWVVDLDLEKFFDRVNHDVLMSRVARRVKDKTVLLLIGRFLRAGMMEGGLVSPRGEGTPQGGSLSPLLSNILLDDLDKELERRRHRFVRYADDCNVYVKSQAAGERVMASLERFLTKRLRLKVNREKSAVARPWKRKFLGFSVTVQRDTRLKVAPQSLKRLKAKLRPLLRMGRGRNLKAVVEDLNRIIRGWVAYFRLSQVKAGFEAVDDWLRHNLRTIYWRQWRCYKGRLRELIRRGFPRARAQANASCGRGPWHTARMWLNLAIPNAELRDLGLMSLVAEHRRLELST